MRLYVQWSLSTPGDWQAIDLDTSGARRRNWERTPTKPEPVGGEVLDSNPGWVFALNVQGLIFQGLDHYAVEPLADGSLRVTTWNNDPGDFSPLQYEARVWTFQPLATDPKLVAMNQVTIDAIARGQRIVIDGVDRTAEWQPYPTINTRQSQVIYAATSQYAAYLSMGPIENTVLRPWADFTPPAANITRHGIWVSDIGPYHLARVDHGWREWA